MRAEIVLTSEQAAVIERLLSPGLVVLGRVMREPFDGTNATTSGRLTLELGTVPESSLPALRDAIRTATAPGLAKRKRSGQP